MKSIGLGHSNVYSLDELEPRKNDLFDYSV